ncbi:hypothetical protein GCM10010472_71790 [Pseudonocardia halophobica]|uniref:TIR domain-containing protein n=1 Tax=Pseudonocardia halophobica TaxID=29401 RepID=A0A9W6NVK7_9PSEU|nr:TIR domain-containing protein [Pseudonocardia halophobica]GLL10949.1 hypothetical protein GCM10017577_20900 [Pseudonocardia halophobica]
MDREGYALGVDIGMSTVAAAVCRQGITDAVVLAGVAAVVPTRYRLDEHAQAVLGEPEGPIRPLGDDAPPGALVRLLRTIVDVVSDREGGPPDAAVIAHPTSWDEAHRDRLAAAVRLLDLPATRIVTTHEAVAAHLAATEEAGDARSVAVLDAGATQCTTAVVVRRAGRFEVLSTETSPGADGADETLRRRLGPDVELSVSAVRRAREELTTAADTTVVGVGGEVHLDRRQLEMVLALPISSAVLALMATLRAAGFPEGRGDGLRCVAVVGGWSRTPLLRELLEQHLPASVLCFPGEPDIVAARGAAVLAEHDRVVLAEAEPVAWDDDVQFTVHRPATVSAKTWTPLLLFAHKTDAVVDPDSGETVDPTHLVQKAAERAVADRSEPYGSVAAPAAQRLAHGDEIVVEPWLREGEVNPPSAAFRWEEAVHKVEFRIRASERAVGRSLSGGVRIFLGVVLIGEVTFRIAVTRGRQAATPPRERDVAVRYRKIFASYSHRDADIVRAVSSAVSVIGDRYIVDSAALRAGERWEPRLRELIEEADVFQLFWSHNAMRSEHVRDEWEYALRLGREGFVRPVFWEDPRPQDVAAGLPPESLDRLHWSWLHPPVPTAARRPAGPPPRPALPPPEAAVTVPHSPPPPSAPAGAPLPPPTVRIGTPDLPPPFGAAGDRSAPSAAGARRKKRHLALLAAAAALVIVGGAAVVGQVNSGPTGGAAVAAAPPARGADSAGSFRAIGTDRSALSPDGATLYLAATGGVRALPATDLAGGVTIPVTGGEVRALSVSLDGSQVFASLGGAVPAVVVLDPVARSEVGRFQLPAAAASVRPVPGRPELVAALPGRRAVALVDTSTGTVTTPPSPLAADWLRVGLDGRAWFLANADTAALGVTLADSAVGTTIPLPGPPAVIAIRETGVRQQLAVATGATVAVLEWPGGAATASVQVPTGPRALAWAPEGAILYVADAAGSLLVVDTARAIVTRTIPVGAVAAELVVSPDGRYGYQYNADGSVTKVDLAG